ncbi:hypothetical protein B0H17DRAFT_1217324 [Mycena rosella]|uniref:BTB domain-containing protein n=1 Tax=Mycena rosella TaxID=1033263 RepID=A0AAD7FNI2_MYCRO|nr:hypothetical protein B0H17DRAFT_1217324 [Mycena rosella]
MPTGVPPRKSGAPASGAEGEAALILAEGLWFEDCGLIIQAENTLFRVSGDFLATRSPVFADMLSLPKPQDAALMYGCLVVHLSDSAQDTTVFLKALIYSEFFEPFPAPTTFPILSGVLRMSHKYAVDVLRKRSLVHLSSAHPMSLTEWERADVDFTPSWFDAQYCDYIGMVLLARQTSAFWILPTVFYRMCRHSHRREGAIITGALQSRDKVIYIRAARFLESSATSTMLDFLWPTRQSKVCADCIQSRHRVRRIAEGRRRLSPEDDIGFMPLEIWGEEDWEKLDVCRRCLSEMENNHREAKQHLWERLPEIFELPDWDCLGQMKEEALR